MNSSQRPPRNLRRALSMLMVLALSLTTPSMAPSPADIATENLSVTISADPAPYAAGQPIYITFTVSNPGPGKARFCKYMTPLEGFNGPIFDLSDMEGDEVEYAGVMKKRGKPGDDDYVTLEPGDNITTRFDLCVPYPIKEAGAYQLKFRGSKSINKLPDSNPLHITVAKP